MNIFKRKTAEIANEKAKKAGRQVTTKSGKVIKVHRSLSDQIKARKDAKVKKRAEYLKNLPKSRFKRVLYRLHPKRVLKYWFSREGLIMALKITGVGIALGFLLIVGVFAYFRKDLPNLKDISGNNIGGSIRYYDRTGQTLLWEDYDAVKRVAVKNEDIAQSMKDATIAIEDREFFNHGGFYLKGIIRAAYNNAFGGSTQGGSTITQQLVKLSIPGYSNDRSVKRKVKELILSVELERSYSKNEILAGYLNSAPYGGIEYGVESAAQDYFGKSAKDLTLDESALLASIPKSPEYFSPYSPELDKPSLVARQHYVLDVMADMGKISKDQRDEAKKTDTLAKVKDLKQKYAGIKAPYFVLQAKSELTQKYAPGIAKQGVKIGGWKVTTTLDLTLQAEAEKDVAAGMQTVKNAINPVHPKTGVRNNDAKNGAKAAMTAEDVKTGQVVAMVGGPDFNDDAHGGKINFAHSRLAPGSSFKPYDYASLIENTTNSGAGSVLFDSKGPVGGYKCTKPNLGRTTPGADCLYDYDSRFPGPLTLRYALGGSRNVPAVKAFEIAGGDKVRETAKKMGLTSGYKCYADEKREIEDNCYSASGIGDGAYLYQDEHVHGYATIARNGVNIPQTYILKIEDSKSKTFYEWKQTQGEQAIKDETAYILGDMMMDPNASYFPAGRKPHNGVNGNKFAMKTGSTNDSRDGWMMGFSTHYAVGVWVGHYTSEYEMTGFMENLTQPIWQPFMTFANKNLPAEERPRPAGIQVLPAFVVQHTFSSAGGEVTPSRSTDLFPSWYQGNKNKSNQKRTIDIVSNKIATDCTPSLARQEITSGSADFFSSDTIINGGAGGTTETDDIHKCDDVKPTITMIDPTALGGGQYHLSATVTQGTWPLTGEKGKGQVVFKIDGQVIKAFDADPAVSTYQFDYTSTFDGTKTIVAQVIDSVLYDATDQREVALVNATSGFSAAYNSGTSMVTWNTVASGPYKFRYTKKGGSQKTVSNASSPFDTTALSPGEYTAYVEASDGTITNTVNFTVL